LQRIGLAQIAAHEAALTAYALERLPQVPGLRVRGDTDPARAHERLGVVPFTLDGIDHRLVAAVLSCEYGIAVRNGAFCAQPYVRHLLGPDAADLACGSADQPMGLVRVSFGLDNTLADVDALVDALEAIVRHTYRGSYAPDEHGAYRARGWQPRLAHYFSLDQE
jgi:selenocysteine lyase/cysteine desulfurase